MASSPWRLGGTRLRKYSQMDDREFRSAAIPVRDTLVQAISELANGPDIMGSKIREEIIGGLRTLHVARRGRRGRHFLLYRVAPGGIIEIVRILHDRMDLQRHLPFAGDKSGE